MLTDASYLRDIAQQCAVLARQCPHLPTSQALEALSIQLMEQASEMERESSLLRSADEGDGSN
jgi:hypothetical protein